MNDVEYVSHLGPDYELCECLDCRIFDGRGLRGGSGAGVGERAEHAEAEAQDQR